MNWLNVSRKQARDGKVQPGRRGHGVFELNSNRLSVGVLWPVDAAGRLNAASPERAATNVAITKRTACLRAAGWTTYALAHEALNRVAQENLALNLVRERDAASTPAPAAS